MCARDRKTPETKTPDLSLISEGGVTPREIFSPLDSPHTTAVPRNLGARRAPLRIADGLAVVVVEIGEGPHHAHDHLALLDRQIDELDAHARLPRRLVRTERVDPDDLALDLDQVPAQLLRHPEAQV